ncbi:hypothetical protein AB0I39_35985 [Kitasatospora purpeofusca]|uniref:hypothetical protein n=1 Tax=Kitasatospora purpeofusca TaxID=67352 RepID=UPI0033E0FA99
MSCCSTEGTCSTGTEADGAVDVAVDAVAVAEAEAEAEADTRAADADRVPARQA